MAFDNPETLGSEYDEALGQQSNQFQLQPAFVAAMSVKEIIKVCGSEFHESIILRNNDGLVTNYLPDQLESFENSVECLASCLKSYSEEELKLSRDGERKERREQAFALLRKLFAIMVSINLMPGNGSSIVEVVGKIKAEHLKAKKEAEKEAEKIAKV